MSAAVHEGRALVAPRRQAEDEIVRDALRATRAMELKVAVTVVTDNLQPPRECLFVRRQPVVNRRTPAAADGLELVVLV